MIRRAIVAATLSVAVIPAIVWAHATLLSSTPAAGSRLAQSPSRIHLVFSEPVVAALSHVRLIDAGGKVRTLAVRPDPQNVRAIDAPSGALPGGAYTVEWHIVSADGHPVWGQFTFGVGATAVAPPPAATVGHRDGQPATSVAATGEAAVAGTAFFPALFRGLGLAALLAVCGLLGFAGYSPQDDPLRQRLAAWLSVAATLLLAAHLVAWLIHVAPSNRLDASLVRETLSGEVGLNELVRLVLTALTVWAVILARRLRIGFAFALAAVLAGGAIGHPAAIAPLAAIPSKALHLVGVAFWMGGLLWIMSARTASMDTISGVETVSNVALISATTVAITGIIQSVLFLPSWADLTASAYGLVLLGKTVGLAALIAFGAYHRYRLLPRIVSGGSESHLRRSLRLEIGVMFLVILLGGLLAYIPLPNPVTSHASTSTTDRA